MPARLNDSSRRQFLKGAIAVTSSGLLPAVCRAQEATATKMPETLVAELYQSFSPEQRSAVCFDWDFRDQQRGLLRSRIANNWQVTPHRVTSSFYGTNQQEMIRAIFEGLIAPEWHKRYDQQLDDDCGGWGDQSIAIFGEPGHGKFELVLTGRHMTLRCDGNSADHVAFGGPIFYGHAPEDNETLEHAGNVFWEQAIEANRIYSILDGRQQQLARVERSPQEQHVAFRPMQEVPGIPITELTVDQTDQVQKTLRSMLGMFRKADQSEATACLEKQGGLDACHLAFYTDHDIGQDSVWDNWRIQGPSFVWHFRGAPHVHVWVNLADDAKVELNA